MYDLYNYYTLKVILCQHLEFIYITRNLRYNYSNITEYQGEFGYMNELDLKAMGMRLRKQRELLGYTRDELAEKLDVSSKFCSDIELGVKGMSLNTLSKISEILCLSTDYILFGESNLSSAEIKAIESLVNQCPKQYRTNLMTIVREFVDSVR